MDTLRANSYTACTITDGIEKEASILGFRALSIFALQAARTKAAYQTPSDADMDLANADDRLHEEMQRLAAINQELLGGRPDSAESFHLPEENDELTRLRNENAELRARVEELENALQASIPADARPRADR